MRYQTALAVAAAWGLLACNAALADDSGRHIAQSLADTKVSLRDAIRTAEKEGNGLAVGADYEFKGGNPAFYEVKVLSNDGRKLTRYDINPATGKVKDSSDAKLEKLLTRIKPEAVRNAQTSLTRAITTAEERAHGRAYSADVDRDGDQVKYTVKVVRRDGTEEKVKINGADGKVASAE
ncbi:MAG: PepSY domain-containing protein [Sinobacteraceae bacterium]|nr:PepSY domain-containing protein [Nevskiaceae bacterium]MBV8854754.1 PepSY domain-containing protein [Nevskiaceae bacterium]MBV9911232.1 PepSY domain-containing protein [Nevskiaceae bacterium]